MIVWALIMKGILSLDGSDHKIGFFLSRHFLTHLPQRPELQGLGLANLYTAGMTTAQVAFCGNTQAGLQTDVVMGAGLSTFPTANAGLPVYHKNIGDGVFVKGLGGTGRCAKRLSTLEAGGCLDHPLVHVHQYMNVALSTPVVVVLLERTGAFTIEAAQTAVCVYVNHQHVLHPLCSIAGKWVDTTSLARKS
jgi:hypothetical protein